MNTFRYYNLSKMALGAYNGLGVSWHVKATVDLLAMTDYGNITAGSDNFPMHGHGLHKGTMLSNSFSFGDLTATSVATFDYGAVA